MLKLHNHQCADNDDGNQKQCRLINGTGNGGDQNGNNLHTIDDGTTKNEDLRQTLNNLQLELNQAKEALIGENLIIDLFFKSCQGV